MNDQPLWLSLVWLAVLLIFLLWIWRSSRRIDRRYDRPEVEARSERQTVAAERQAEAIWRSSRRIDRRYDRPEVEARSERQTVAAERQAEATKDLADAVAYLARKIGES